MGKYVCGWWREGEEGGKGQEGDGSPVCVIFFGGEEVRR